MKKLKKIEKPIKIAVLLVAISAGFDVLFFAARKIGAEFGEFAGLSAVLFDDLSALFALGAAIALLRAVWLAEALLKALRARGVAVQVCNFAWLLGLCALMLASGALVLAQIFVPAGEYAELLDKAQDVLRLALWVLLFYRLWRSLRTLQQHEELLGD